MQGILLAHISRSLSRTKDSSWTSRCSIRPSRSSACTAGIVAATGRSPGRLGNEHPSLAPYEPYPASDGDVIVAVANPRLWSRFCAALGAEALEHDPRFATNSARLTNRLPLNEAIRELFRNETVDALIDRLTAAGVPCGRVRTIEDVLGDSQLAVRQMLVDIQTSERPVKVPGNPVKLSDSEDAGCRGAAGTRGAYGRCAQSIGRQAIVRLKKDVRVFTARPVW